MCSSDLRFGQLKKSIGSVSQKVLTAQLRDMEATGLLTRKVYAQVPPKVEYTLTDTGPFVCVYSGDTLCTLIRFET